MNEYTYKKAFGVVVVISLLLLASNSFGEAGRRNPPRMPIPLWPEALYQTSKHPRAAMALITRLLRSRRYNCRRNVYRQSA